MRVQVKKIPWVTLMRSSHENYLFRKLSPHFGFPVKGSF